MAIKDIKFIRTNDYSKITGSYTKNGIEHQSISEEYPNSIISVSDNTIGKTDLFIGSERMTDNYNSNAKDDWESVKVGGLESTTADVLKSKSTSELLDAILFPAYPAEVTQPSFVCKCSYKDCVMEIGDNLPIITDDDCSFENVDRGYSKYGTITNGVWDKNDHFYAGQALEKHINIVSNSADGKVKDGDNTITITYSVSFENGNQPANNRGEANGTRFLRNTITQTKTITIKGVRPMFCNGKWIDTNEAKAVNEGNIETPYENPVQTITDSNTVAVSFAPQILKTDGTYQDPFRIYLFDKEIESIETLSDLSGKWDKNTNRGDFEEKETSIYLPTKGGTVGYTLWEFKLEQTGHAKIKFNLKNKS